MTQEKIFPLKPGNTKKDTTDIDILVTKDKNANPSTVEIKARNKEGATVILCPSPCQDNENIGDEGTEFTLEQEGDEYKVVASGPNFLSRVICPSPCPIKKLL